MPQVRTSHRGFRHGRSNFVVYSRPQGPEIDLPIPPRIAKWVGKASPLQRPLTEYLDSVEKLIQTANVPDEGLTLDLTVGLPEGTDLLLSGDLDNYLIHAAVIAAQAGWI